MSKVVDSNYNVDALDFFHSPSILSLVPRESSLVKLSFSPYTI